MWVGTESLERTTSEIADVLEAVRRYGLALCGWIALVLCGTAAVLGTIEPQYPAATQIMLEQPARANDRADVVRQFHQLTLDDAQAQTQLHEILSERVLRKAFESLDLTRSPELSPESDGPLQRLVLWLDSVGATEVGSNPATAFLRFREKVHARRIGLSYVIEIYYWAQDFAQARRVVNAVAAAYMQDRIEIAAAVARLGPAPAKRRLARIETEGLIATAALRAGAVPGTDFPDAAVRILGATPQPVGKFFPRSLPVFAIALCFAVISGALVVALTAQTDRRIRSPRRLRTRAGLAAIGAPRVRRWWKHAFRRSRDLPWRTTVGAVRAAIYRTGQADPRRRIGIVGSGDDREAGRLAADLKHLMHGTEPSVPEADAACGVAMRHLPIPVLALSRVHSSAEVRVELDALDAVILVLEADRTTLDDVDVILRALRDSDVTLLGTVLTR